VSLWDTLPRPSPLMCAGCCLWTPWVVAGVFPPRRGVLASPSSGSQPPPLVRRYWSADGAGPPAAADTCPGRTCKRSAPGALGSREEGRGSISASSYLSHTKGAPLPGLDLLCLPLDKGNLCKVFSTVPGRERVLKQMLMRSLTTVDRGGGRRVC